MVFFIKLSRVTILLSLIQFSHCRRRIQGAEVDEDKIYAVYMVKESQNVNTDWLCGGAIVTEWYIVTSAACVQDLKHTYAIAGYKKYVKGNDIKNDECTKRKKKKVVFSCVPKSYKFGHEHMKWTKIDIAVAKVESKYNFKDKSYLQYCSYIPGPIDINYDGKYQRPGTDAIALGWGHAHSFMFNKTDNKTYNQENINYAPLLLVPKSVCKNAYEDYEDKDNIDRYMICAQGVGNLDDMGHMINKYRPRVDGCITEDQKLKGLKGILCEDKDMIRSDPYDEVYQSDYYVEDNITRRDNTNAKSEGRNKSDENFTKSKKIFNSSNVGICQNDHGGPLVTWVGARAVLIGVITTYLVTSESQCKGPYLFTSTQCNSKFLDCVINYETQNDTKRKLCDSPHEIGFEMKQMHLSWDDNPSGPAKNEILEGRPQIPIQRYHFEDQKK